MVKEMRRVRVCKMCNKEYERSESGAGYKYCSQDCSDEARRIRNRDRWRAANPGWDAETDKVCEWCGQAFTVPAKFNRLNETTITV